MGAAIRGLFSRPHASGVRSMELDIFAVDGRSRQPLQHPSILPFSDSAIELLPSFVQRVLAVACMPAHLQKASKPVPEQKTLAWQSNFVYYPLILLVLLSNIVSYSHNCFQKFQTRNDLIMNKCEKFSNPSTRGKAAFRINLNRQGKLSSI